MLNLPFVMGVKLQLVLPGEERKICLGVRRINGCWF